MKLFYLLPDERRKEPFSLLKKKSSGCRKEGRIYATMRLG